MSGPASTHVRESDRLNQIAARNNVAVAWRLCRNYYSAEVIARVDELLLAGGPSMLDLVLIGMAETFEAQRLRLECVHIDDERKCTRQIFEIQRQVANQVKELGGGGGLDNKPVPIPEGVLKRSSMDVDPVLELVTG